MVLTIPPYVRAAGIANASIRYKWDDWDIEGVQGPIDEALRGRLCGVSQRASVALTIATGEWVVYRFAALLNDPFPLQCLEAAWAQVVDVQYSFPWILEEEESWTGPIKKPVMTALGLVTGAVEEMATDAYPDLCAATMIRLATHVISDPLPFQAWIEQVIRRLELLYPRDPEETMGDVVPREVFDPDVDFRIENTENLIDAFLSRLKRDENVLLQSPEDMLAQGFQGIPYAFDIESDRRARFEW